MVYEQLKGMIAKQLKVAEDKVTLQARLQEDLRADSANVMMLIMDIEEAFGIEVEDEAIETVKTVGDLVAYIEGKQ